MISLILAITIAICACFQSILQLKNEDGINSKPQKALALIVVIGTVITVISIYIQYNDNENFQKKIDAIITNSSKQLGFALENQHKADSVTNKLDSVYNNLNNIVVSYEQLTDQYNIVKDRLSDEIDLDKKKLAERVPIFQLRTYDFKWSCMEDSSYTLMACLKNYGGRSAIINSVTGHILFVDSRDRIVSHVNINNSFAPGYYLEPISQAGALKCISSDQIIDYNPYKTSYFSNFAIIFLKLNYNDLLSNKPVERIFWFSWIPDKKFNAFNDKQLQQVCSNWISENVK